VYWVSGMADICELHVSGGEIGDVSVCDTGHTCFMERTSLVNVGETGLVLIPTVRYRLSFKPAGLAIGKHLFSTTLVPGEEVEVEIFRSSKVVDELSQQSSVEETLAQELSSTAQDEWSKKQESNFKIGGGVSASLDLGFFSLGGHAEPEYSTHEETFQKSLNEFVAKASAKVDRKNDIHMDVKTETSEGTRSTRTLRNFNQCQPVTYNYFQLARKIHFEAVIDAVFFDSPPPQTSPHPMLTQKYDALFNVATFVPPKPETVLGAISQQPQPPPALRLAEAAVAGSAPPLSVVGRATVQHPVVASEYDHPVSHLTQKQLELKLGSLDPAERNAVLSQAQSVANQFPLGTIVTSTDFCVNTTGTAVESTTGRCVACDTHTALVQEAERDKLRLEIIKTQQERIAAASVFGFVRSTAGSTRGAVVRLRRGQNNAVIGETVTDADGLYALFAKGLPGENEDLVVDVPTLPSGLSSVEPTEVIFTPDVQGPREIDFVARP
jgi:hypothetical protein